MTKRREIKELREIASKVKIVKEIEREKNDEENNFVNLEFVNGFDLSRQKKKVVVKKKEGEKLEEVIEVEKVKDENKGREDIERNREAFDEKDNARNLYGTTSDGDSSRAYGINNGGGNTRDYLGNARVDENPNNKYIGHNEGTINNEDGIRSNDGVRRIGDNNYDGNTIRDENELDKKRRDLR